MVHDLAHEYLFSAKQYLSNFYSTESFLLRFYEVKESLNFNIMKLCGSVITEISIIEMSGIE